MLIFCISNLFIDEEITTEKFSFAESPKSDQQSETVKDIKDEGGLSINLQFEQETTSRRAPLSVSDIFSVKSESGKNPFRFSSTDDASFSTPPESPRTFDTSKFFKTKSNLPSNGFSKPKTSSKNNFFSISQKKEIDEKKNVLLKDIFDILDDKPLTSQTSTTPRPSTSVVVNEKRLPFTVVRVSSSVSQIRPNNNENDIRVSEVTTKIEKEDNDGEENDISPLRPLFFPTRENPTTTTEKDVHDTSDEERRIKSDKKKAEKKKSGDKSSGGRQPFLKPIAKFPDIRIPSLDKNRNSGGNNVRKQRPTFNFNRGAGKGRPLSPVLGFRTSTTTESTTTPFSTSRLESLATESSIASTTLSPRTFANIFNRFSFATQETSDETTESIEAIKSLLDLIPKDEERKETTSARSLLELIPGLNTNGETDIDSFDFGNGNEIDADEESLQKEVNTLRASLDIIPIKSTTDRNSLNEVDEVQQSKEVKEAIEEERSQDTLEIPEKTRDLEIIPIPPRPSRPTTTPIDVTETTTGAILFEDTTIKQTTRRKLSRLQEIVQRRRTTTPSSIVRKTSSGPFSRKKLFEKSRKSGNRPTISIRFRNQANRTTFDIKPTNAAPIEEVKEDEKVNPTEQLLSFKEQLLSLDSIETTPETEEATTFEPTTNEVKPTIGGRGRSRSRFRPSKLSDLFPKRRPAENSRRRPFLRPRNRGSTLSPSSTTVDEDDLTKPTSVTLQESGTAETATRRSPTFRRLPTRPPAPQNTRSPLLKSILDRARLRGNGRRTTRAPITIVNKV